MAEWAAEDQACFSIVILLPLKEQEASDQQADRLGSSIHLPRKREVSVLCNSLIS